MSNVIAFTGHLGGDAERRAIPSGTTVLSFSVACKVGHGERESTVWFRCQIWGKRAEGRLQEFLTKGSRVYVSGELRTSTWQSRDGGERTSLDVNVDRLDLLGARGDRPAQDPPHVPAAPAKPDPMLDDDIPF